MLAGYHSCGKMDQASCFDLYFRKLPFGGGFCVAAGLETALDYLTELRFEQPQLEYLKSLNLFSADFLSWLAKFRFEGDVEAVAEGELVFPGEPLLRIRAPLPHAQLVESALLNIINFQTLIATKAARVYVASQQGTVLEFGLRRAQGIDGSLSASRASYIGGCSATSNTLAGQKFGIPVKGTHAHSWIMSFDTELEAFRAYANLYPDSCTLLVDTYDTLNSGVPNAVKVGLELKEKGHTLAGIRLDSGDLAELSKGARQQLDAAGLSEAKIVASNDLDENLVANLLSQGARIDVWGVGTNLVTARDQPALGGVYKLVAAEGADGQMEPRIKVSSNPIKTTVPGIKQVYRAEDSAGNALGDVIALESETIESASSVPTHSPLYAELKRRVEASTFRPLLKPVLKGGQRVGTQPGLGEIRDACLANLKKLPDQHKRRMNPHIYWVGLSDELYQLRHNLLSTAD